MSATTKSATGWMQFYLKEGKSIEFRRADIVVKTASSKQRESRSTILENEIKPLILLFKLTFVVATIFRIPALIARNQTIRQMWLEWEDRSKRTAPYSLLDQLLPVELQLEIARRLDLRSLITLSRCNIKWHHLISEDASLWRHLMARDFPQSQPVPIELCNRRAYQIKYVCRKASMEIYYSQHTAHGIECCSHCCKPQNYRRKCQPTAINSSEAIEFEFEHALNSTIAVLAVLVRLSVATLLFPVHWLSCFIYMPQRWLNLSAATIGASALPRSVETEGTLSRVIGDLLFQSHAHYLNIYLFQMLPGIHYSSSRSLSHHDSSLMTMLILTAASLPLIIMDFIGYAVFIAIHRPLLWFTLPSTTFRDYDTWRFFKYVKVCWSVVKMLGSVLVLFYAHYQLIIITLGNISGLIGQLIQHLFWAASIFIVANERTLTYISQSLLSRFHSNKNDTSMMVNMCTFHLIWAIVSVENWLVGLSRAFLSTVISLTLLCCTMLSIWPVY